MESFPETSSCGARLVARFVIAGFTVAALGAFAFAQWGGGGSGFYSRAPEGTRTARELPSRRIGFPEWENPKGFEQDVLTFARLRYGGYGMSNGAGGGSWATDLPDADINLSYRLQQLTSLKTDPNGRILRANDPDLYKYPFLMTSAPGAMVLSNDEIRGLRDYLLNGGFFLLTDFWGDREWNHFESVMRQVLPGRSFVELPLTHEIYHNVFEIRDKNLVPRIGVWNQHIRSGGAYPLWERDESGSVVHHRAIFDDKGRMIVLALHNSDDSDGWESESDNPVYFTTYSEKMAYPLAINIIFYVMTH